MSSKLEQISYQCSCVSHSCLMLSYNCLFIIKLCVVGLLHVMPSLLSKFDVHVLCVMCTQYVSGLLFASSSALFCAVFWFALGSFLDVSCGPFLVSRFSQQATPSCDVIISIL